jgi:hypothetical protein
MIKLLDLLKDILLEDIGAGSSIVYHRTKPSNIKSIFEKGFIYPEQSIHWDWYGKGVYTTYDLESQNTIPMAKSYGSYIIKCQVVDYNKVLILDYNEAKKIYKSKYLFSDQIRYFINNKNKLINVFGNDYVNVIKQIDEEISKVEYTADIAKKLYDDYHIDVFINGIVFTGRNDGRVFVSYKPQNIKPLAFVKADKKISNLNDLEWISKFNKELYKKTENYTLSVFEKIIKQEPLTDEEKNVEGDLKLGGTNIPTLPEGLKINGSLFLSESGIRNFPKNIQIKDNLELIGCKNLTSISTLNLNGDLRIRESSIEVLPPNLQVKGDVDASDSKLKTISKGIKIGGILDIQTTDVISLPDDIQAKEIKINPFKLKNIPENIRPLISKEISTIDLLIYLNDNLDEIPKYKNILEKEGAPMMLYVIREWKKYDLLKSDYIKSLLFDNPKKEYISLGPILAYFEYEDIEELSSTGIYDSPVFINYISKQKYFKQLVIYLLITHPELYPYFKNIFKQIKPYLKSIETDGFPSLQYSPGYDDFVKIPKSQLRKSLSILSNKP